MHRFAIVIWLFIPGILFAEDDPAPLPFPEAPDLPPPLESGESLDPDITIIRRGKKTIQEYRVNGKLYMIKIVPDAGPPYYLVDSDGDGNMDVRRSDLEKGLQVPEWVIFSW